MRRTTGHVGERSPGRWELRYSLGADPATGKRKTAAATVDGTLKDAERELRRLLPAIDTGEHIESDKILARQWFEQWLRMARPEISPLTYRLYDQAVSLYLAPAIGHLPFAKLTPAHIQTAYSKLAQGGRRDGKAGPLAATTRRLIHRVLTASLNRALELQLINRNPALVLRRRCRRPTAAIWQSCHRNNVAKCSTRSVAPNFTCPSLSAWQAELGGEKSPRFGGGR